MWGLTVMAFRISPDGATLAILAAHASHGGAYTCVATNAAGEEDRTFNLKVYGEVTFHFSSLLLFF